MADRAEERALEAYPVKEEWVGNQYGEWGDTNASSRVKYQEGYEQAEKDLALTWEDIRKIEFLCQRQFVQKGAPHDEEKWYTEVLKRFLESKRV